MTVAELVPLALKASISILVFSIGLGTAPREFTHFQRHPGQLLRSLVAMNLAMPIIAVSIVLLMELHQPVRILLVALALSPVPPLLPQKLVKAGGQHAYVMALLFTASLASILFTPLATIILDRIFPAEIRVPISLVGGLVFVSVVAPTIVGMLVRIAAPAFALQIQKPLAMAATALLVLAGLLILVKAGPAMLGQVGHGTVIAIALFILAGLIIGHLLGGPSSGDRSVLALATASRHPGIALAMAHVTFPAEKAVPAAALLYLVLTALITIPYVIWRKHTLSDNAVGPA